MKQIILFLQKIFKTSAVSWKLDIDIASFTFTLFSNAYLLFLTFCPFTDPFTSFIHTAFSPSRLLYPEFTPTSPRVYTTFHSSPRLQVPYLALLPPSSIFTGGCSKWVVSNFTDDS